MRATRHLVAVIVAVVALAALGVNGFQGAPVVEAVAYGPDGSMTSPVPSAKSISATTVVPIDKFKLAQGFSIEGITLVTSDKNTHGTAQVAGLFITLRDVNGGITILSSITVDTLDDIGRTFGIAPTPNNLTSIDADRLDKLLPLAVASIPGLVGNNGNTVNDLVSTQSTSGTDPVGHNGALLRDTGPLAPGTNYLTNNGCATASPGTGCALPTIPIASKTACAAPENPSGRCIAVTVVNQANTPAPKQGSPDVKGLNSAYFPWYTQGLLNSLLRDAHVPDLLVITAPAASTAPVQTDDFTGQGPAPLVSGNGFSTNDAFAQSNTPAAVPVKDFRLLGKTKMFGTTGYDRWRLTTLALTPGGINGTNGSTTIDQKTITSEVSDVDTSATSAYNGPTTPRPGTDTKASPPTGIIDAAVTTNPSTGSPGGGEPCLFCGSLQHLETIALMVTAAALFGGLGVYLVSRGRPA